jgi:hypothetical protein
MGGGVSVSSVKPEHFGRARSIGHQRVPVRWFGQMSCPTGFSGLACEDFAP